MEVIKVEKQFCGVRKDKIMSANPKFNKNLNTMKYWITERQNILRKKEAGESYPWTDDEILQKVRFCNVNRQDDKETKYLKEKVCLNSNLSLENKILNIILFRLFNKSETFERLGGFPYDFATFDIMSLEDKVRQLHSEGYNLFTGAFMISALVRVSNKNSTYDLGALNVLNNFNAQKYIAYMCIKASDQQELYDTLRTFKGIGSFLAYQMFVDITYIPNCPFGRNHFVVSALGAQDGIKRIVEDYDGLTKEEIMFYLKYRDEFFQTIDLSDIENCLCETSKYIRIRDTGNYRIAKNLYVVRG